jgi:DNA gyrase subunit A
VVLATREGMAIRFVERDVREMGRATTGVRGIILAEGRRGDRDGGHQARLVAAGGDRAGDGEAHPARGLPLQRRGGKGVINIRTTPKTGKVVSIKRVVPGDELMLITKNGIVNRQSVDGSA